MKQLLTKNIAEYCKFSHVKNKIGKDVYKIINKIPLLDIAFVSGYYLNYVIARHNYSGYKMKQTLFKRILNIVFGDPQNYWKRFFINDAKQQFYNWNKLFIKL